MAAYREHVTVSGLLGCAVGAGSWLLLGFTPVQGMLAGWFTAIGGILPDLDSESGRPVREMFGLTASIAPLLLIGRVLYLTGLPNEPETVMVLFLGMYIGIKYGLSLLVGKIAVHRGMFHSVPALLIAAEGTYLAYPGQSVTVKLLMGAGVAIGFLSHLLLDELYSVQWSGVRISLKKSAGSAFKMFGPEFGANAVAYMLLAGLTVVTLTEAGIIGPADAPPKRFSGDGLPVAVAPEGPRSDVPQPAAAQSDSRVRRLPNTVDGYPVPAFPARDDVATPSADSILR
ncbi:MAG: metal-dependent hydrolase [Planctomycetaceae bacterium]|nr:metal-dependent hydrolase [Planctomycetaceae bacterium]